MTDQLLLDVAAMLGAFVEDDVPIRRGSARDLLARVRRHPDYVDPDDVIHMAESCDNIDKDSRGWYALKVDRARGTERVGRGRTAWEAVRDAHAG